MATEPGRIAIDLHAHTSASFDGTVDPLEMCRLAVDRGLTHLAITDHDVISGALRAREAAPAGLTVIVGQEVRSTVGDVIALYVEEPIASGQSLAATVAAIRAQGGLVGLAHPFDASRPSVAVGEEHPDRLRALAELVDFVEIHNGRVRDEMANAHAADFARTYSVPGIAASDAHIAGDIGRVFTVLDSSPEGPEDLLGLLRGNIRLVVRHDPDDPRQTRLQRLKRFLSVPP